MARKSRKHPNIEALLQPAKDTVGYIRLSVSNEDSAGSIESQKLMIEEWGHQHQVPISHYYIDNGFSGRHFGRPAFQQMIQDTDAGKIDCIVVKDLSRLGRDYITVGYYLELFFPNKMVRFVSINDYFDTMDGITNQNKEGLVQSRTRIPLINLFNEQVSLDTKKKVEVVLDMKAQHGKFIGPRAPFGYQKSSENPNQLVPDPAAAAIVRKIFEMSAEGIALTAIVRHLNEDGLPTPIQYARANGLVGNYDDGSGHWNSRSVKYILTNRTYTGMLVQGKEKRAVNATHEPLVDTDTFDMIQRAFRAKAYNVAAQKQTTDNILRGKVICGCCGGKMQRKRGSNHADWYFFTCITKNRLGAHKCTGMYAREEDIFQVIYQQLSIYLKEHFISDSQYRKQLQDFNSQIAFLANQCEEAGANSMKQYEQFVLGKISKENLRVAMDATKEIRDNLAEAVERKAAYQQQYKAFRKLLSASGKQIPLSEIVDCIAEVRVGQSKKIVVKWDV